MDSHRRTPVVGIVVFLLVFLGIGIPQSKSSLFTVEDLRHDVRTPSQRSASPMISRQSETWIDKPQKDWPQITMINQIEPDLEIPIRIDPRISSEVYGCTIVMAARNGLVLAGNNEDRNHLKTIVTFIPPKDKYYGRIVFGYDDAPMQGGMNDQGLFVDGNSLAPTGWKADPNKPMIAGNIIIVMLATCATCEDVKAVFEKYNVPGLERARIPVADRSGASMVVEYGQGHVQFVRSDSWYQIATNFVMSNVKDGNYPCWRYRTADRILSGAKELSVGLIRDVLEKTHQEGNGLTVYSNIYDLKKGTVHIYNLRNFDEVVVMDLAEELKKGQRRIELPSLFKHAQEAVSTDRFVAAKSAKIAIRCVKD